MNAIYPLKVTRSLESKLVDRVATALNEILADSFALYLKTKNFHWHVVGPHFRAYHELFDEQADQILAMTDAIAERVRKCGSTTLRSIGHVARLQRLKDSDAAGLTAAEMIEELTRDNHMFAESLRRAKVVADAADDLATSGLIDQWTDEAEKRVWFLSASAQR